MTPARRAEIEAYIRRLDLDQLPGWTVEQRIIADLWEALPDAWDEGLEAGASYQFEFATQYESPQPPTNPYHDSRPR
jgi:hypothetical protein